MLMSMADIEIEVLTEPLYWKAFEVVTDIFVNHSSLHVALGALLNDYRAYLEPSFFDAVREGMSLVAIDRSSNTIAGLLVGHDLFKLNPQNLIPFQEKYAPIGALGKKLEEIYLKQRNVTAGEVLLVDMAAIAPAYSGQGLYLQMRKAISDHARQCGFRYVIGELSSPATQKVVLETLCHTACAIVGLADFEHKGKRPFATISNPSSIILAEEIL